MLNHEPLFPELTWSRLSLLDNVLNTRLLIDTGIVTYVLCCLSSHVRDVRAAARFVLHEFRQHMESSVYSETIQVFCSQFMLTMQYVVSSHKPFCLYKYIYLIALYTIEEL